jgi:hypothetical protein
VPVLQKLALRRDDGREEVATLFAPIAREINDKGKDTRFKKADCGQFTLASAARWPRRRPCAPETGPLLSGWRFVQNVFTLALTANGGGHQRCHVGGFPTPTPSLC